MYKVLQEFILDETANALKIEVVFQIFGDKIDVNRITDILELTPTKAWNKGDVFLGAYFDPLARKKCQEHRTRTNGKWEITSSEYVDSLLVEDHLKFMKNLLYPIKKQLLQIENVEKRILSIRKNSLEEVIEYSITPLTISQLAECCDVIKFTNNHSTSLTDII